MPVLSYGSMRSSNGLAVPLLTSLSDDYSLQTPRGIPHARHKCAPESRKNWIADLDRLAALNPTIVVAGHKKPGAPDSPSAIQDTKRYLEDFDRVQKTAASDQELFDQMTALYPDWVANQSWLMFGFPGV
jgi:hypothetical protein